MQVNYLGINNYISVPLYRPNKWWWFGLFRPRLLLLIKSMHLMAFITSQLPGKRPIFQTKLQQEIWVLKSCETMPCTLRALCIKEIKFERDAVWNEMPDMQESVCNWDNCQTSQGTKSTIRTEFGWFAWFFKKMYCHCRMALHRTLAVLF